MELKVWVEGIQRIVCGVTDQTTCQDVVFALCHATNRTGKFTLIERWRNNERYLAPNESPLKILMKWGEYSSDVQFVLQRSDKPLQQQQKSAANNNNNSLSSSKKTLSDQSENNDQTNKKSSDSRKLINISVLGEKTLDNVGIVKGIPQKSATLENLSNDSITNSKYSSKSPNVEFTSADIRNSLEYKLKVRQNSDGKTQHSSKSLDLSNENLPDLNGMRNSNMNANDYNTIVAVSSNGALNPPPYRNPPSPNINFGQKSTDINLSNLKNNNFGILNSIEGISELLVKNSQYRELLQLIKIQKEKINTQQSELTKYDAEIIYLETREQDQIHQLENITQELNKTDQMYRQGYDQLQTLQYIEEENEIVKQQEKTLKSEIALLRSKLANCETELLQCKNKIRLLLDEIQIEQRNFSFQCENRQQIEKHLLNEVDRLQEDIEVALHTSDNASKVTDNLKKDVAIIENSIAEKKKQLEKLVQEMKEVNLQSLAVAPAEEVRHFMESSMKPGSSRRIVGSPRQLENAVPTSKNPHGVWV